MLKYNTILTGPFSTNTYLLWEENTKEAVLIDPSADIDFVLSKIEEQNIIPTAIWLTHGHFDHNFAVGTFAEKLNIPVYMNKKDEELIYIYKDQAVEFGFDINEFKDFANYKYLSEGDTLNLGNEEIKIIECPGHTKGSLCYITSIGVFCGDVIFFCSIGRTDLFGGDYNSLISSIKNKILIMPDDTWLYPGHGNKTTVGTEKDCNPFLS